MTAKTTAQKLLVKPGTTVWISAGEHRPLLSPLPEGAAFAGDLAEAAVGVLFAADAASARHLLETHRDRLTAPPVLWIAYPKGNKADINRDTLWPIAGEYGLRPNGQVAVDAVWSALRFRPLKEGEPPFTGGASRCRHPGQGRPADQTAGPLPARRPRRGRRQPPARPTGACCPASAACACR